MHFYYENINENFCQPNLIDSVAKLFYANKITIHTLKTYFVKM